MTRPSLLLPSLIALAGCLPDDAAVRAGPLSSNVVDWRDEVIYQLIIDRFGDGDLNNDQSVNPSALARYQGGDFQGVIDHIGYLEALGVTAVWVSPVVRNVDTDANVDGYHGYWAQDLTHVNPHFGDLASLRRMVDALHARKIKVILDIVTNHLGQLFYYDINGNGVPDDNVYGAGCKPEDLNRGCVDPQITRITEYDPDFDPRGVQGQTSLGLAGPAALRWIYKPEIHRMPPLPEEFQNPEWYNRKGRVTKWDDPDQRLTGDFPGGLKDVKTALPEVQRAMVRAYTYWIEAADFDGFRIDTLKHVEHEFWQAFCPGVRQFCKDVGKRNFLMFGEAFDGDDKLVGSFTFDEEVDSVFNFPEKFGVIDRVVKQGGPTKEIEDWWNRRASSYSAVPHTDGIVDEQGVGLATQKMLVNFLDNHDIPRFAFDKPCAGRDDCPALWSALTLLLTEEGVPCVYYGTEQELAGGNDPMNRERLWDTGYATSGKTFGFLRNLIDVRKRFRPLRRGATEITWATTRNGAERDAGIFAFERVDGGRRVLVVLNVSDGNTASTQAPDTLGGGRMKVGFAAGTTLRNVLGDPEAITVAGDGTVLVTLPPRGQRVFVAEADQGGIP